MLAPTLWQVFTNRQRFGVYFVGSALSNIGTWCQNLAGILLVYRLTESTLAVGLITVAQFAWPILLAPLAGSIADRVDRRALLTATQVAGAVVAATLGVVTITGQVTVELAIGAVSILGVLLAFQAPTQLALVPSIVSRGDLERGLSLSSAQYNLARAIGPVVASGVIAVWDIGVAFLVNAVSFFAFIIALRFLRPDPTDRPTVPRRFGATVALVRDSRVLMPVLVLAFIANGAADVVGTLGPAISIELAGHDGWTGWFATAFGTGAVLGALVLSSLLGAIRRRLPWTFGVQAVGTALFALAPEPWVALVGAALAGLGFIVSANRSLAIIQSAVPRDLIGRITSLWVVAFLGGRVFFAIAGGFVADLAGPRAVALVVAFLVLAAAGGSLLIRERRRSDAPFTAEPAPPI